MVLEVPRSRLAAVVHAFNIPYEIWSVLVVKQVTISDTHLAHILQETIIFFMVEHT